MTSTIQEANKVVSHSRVQERPNGIQGPAISSGKPHIPQEDALLSWRRTFEAFSQKYELSRKAFHSLTGLFTLWLYANGYSQRQLVTPLVVLASLCFAQETLRFQSSAYNQAFIKYFGFMLRDSERDHYNGILFFLLGLILTSSFLPKDLAVMCNLLLSWADTSALFVGRMYGKYTFAVGPNKSFAGCAASFATGVLSCYLVYTVMIPAYGAQVDAPGDIFYDKHASLLHVNVFALLCGFIASVSECINIYDIDDNFTIPVVSGVLLYGLVWATK